MTLAVHFATDRSRLLVFEAAREMESVEAELWRPQPPSQPEPFGRIDHAYADPSPPLTQLPPFHAAFGPES